ncbi:rhodanese-like domain-containing protein [Mycoplasmatota bacterium zrk1]
MLDSISVNELKSVNKKSINLIDVREPSEFETAHIPNSKNVPLKTLLKSPEEFIKGKTYIVCASGSRSKKVCKKLSKKYDVVNVLGGTAMYSRHYSLIRYVKAGK